MIWALIAFVAWLAFHVCAALDLRARDVILLALCFALWASDRFAEMERS